MNCLKKRDVVFLVIMCFRGTCFLRFCIPGKLRQVGFFDLVTHAE